GEAGLLDAYSLGLGEPVSLSAEHGEGMGELLMALEPIAAEAEEKAALVEAEAPLVDLDVSDEGGEETPTREITKERPLQVAVVGRPNAGKSTLINKLLGEDRLLTGPEAGITRDAISLPLDWDGLPVRIFDTAGMRKNARVQEK
ncbi:MAG: 50S ribosome-binding GTPase, partial [Boseongicola sp.]|nr:50S ribosome-binding GTPase [Boseongicola sp.]